MCVYVFVSLSLFQSLSPSATHCLQTGFSSDFSVWVHMTVTDDTPHQPAVYCVLHASSNKTLLAPMFFWSILWDVLCSTSYSLTHRDNKNPGFCFVLFCHSFHSGVVIFITANTCSQNAHYSKFGMAWEFSIFLLFLMQALS